MRDVDAIKERIACDWWHPQGYKKNKYVLLSKKQQNEISEGWSKHNLLKGIFSDSNNIFLWHKSEDINKKKLFPKFQLILILRS